MNRILSISLEIIFNLVVSIVLLGILGQALTLTLYEQTVIGTLFFLGTLGVWLRYELSKVSQNSGEIIKDRNNLLRILDQVDLLQGISPSLRTIADGLKRLNERYGKDDLFVYWYSKKIEMLNKHLKQTVDTETFDFDQSMTAERSRILDVLKRNSPGYFWAVASCKSIPHFADPDGTAFLRQVDERLKTGGITQVRRLFMFDEGCDLEAKETRILFCLHELNGYEYKVITTNDFKTVMKNFGDKTMTSDFGVWGASFVWETPEQNILTQIGQICRDPNRIALYEQLYEELWALSRPYKFEDKQITDLCRGHRIYDFRTILDYSLH